MMKSRPLQTAILVSLLAALLIMASGLAAQEATSGFALTATWLAGGGKLGDATLTPLPSLTPGTGGAAATRVPATVPAITSPSATPWPSSTPLPSLTPATGGGAVATLPPATVPAVTNPTTTPLPSLTAGPRLTVTSLPSLTPGGQTAATQAVTESVPAATRTLAPSSTPLPSLTPAVAGGAGGGEATPEAGEAVPTESAGVTEATQSASDLAAIRIVVPSVSLAQEAPTAPETAAGLGTLILLMGLGGATVVGLLMLARDRFRDHSDEPANQG